MRSLLVLALIAAAAIGGYFAAVLTAQSPAPIRTVVVTRGSIDVTVDITGSVLAKTSRGLAFGTAGIVATVNGVEGDHVVKNSVIAQIDASAIDAQAKAAASALVSAQSALKLAQDAADNPPSVPAPGQPTAAQLNANVDAAQANVLNAQASVDAVQLAKNGSTIVAPFGGILTQQLLHVGDYIAPGPISGLGFPVELSDPSVLQVSAGASEDDVVKLVENQSADITFDALPGHKVTGSVCTIPASATSVQGVPTYPVTICLSTTDPAVRIGLTADVTVAIAHRDSVLLVPSSAIHLDGDAHVVNLVQSGSVIVPTTVQVGETNGSRTEIVSGLNEGDHVEAGG